MGLVDKGDTRVGFIRVPGHLLQRHPKFAGRALHLEGRHAFLWGGVDTTHILIPNLGNDRQGNNRTGILRALHEEIQRKWIR